ncbi:CoA pyrophosphatase [Phenylobacterium sp. LH3H17]|uniref:CoA pyrophosphatase n=1 Tax=Phenylobacterium sp. LH3H17 TaxID=2903901 RepID=UPI0020C9C325|nr:CoA pyrophosphatase [Phenylobacterium sp. LH3H17]UTP38984.1 CoA pyrophosphatase [Phenylobacterium sp. LH3H17]
MSPHSAPGELRAWIERHLDPLEHRDAAHATSDFDLTPNAFPNEPVELVPAAVLVGLIQRDHGFSVLLTRRSDTMRRHTGQVALPGGRCDPGETVWQTALREAHEEVGLHPDFVSLAGLSSPYRTGTGYLVTPVVGFVRTGFSLVANPDEVADIFETPFGFLMDPVNYQEHEREAPDGQKRRFYAMTHEDQYIWGATAGMLRALYDRLYGAAVA